ncbi:MAG TPA: hypothetical protein VK427_12415, partial [Kofleriaceae bacterium]|nr:hypothetical protein [Kofleriaceae bacterium]
HRLPSQPDGIVLVGVRPRGAIATFGAITGHAAERADPVMPRAFRTMLAHATAELADDPAAAQIVAHYTEVMPAARAAQLASPLFQTPLDWARLPRLAHVLERFAAVTGVIVPRTATFGALYEATHYGGFMPMLYGMPADLAYFSSRGLDPLATIDRYLAAPMLHELTHFARERDALLPPHLDECVAGWLGRHIWRELAFPEPGDDTAIYAAPYLTQIGAAVARAFGADAVVHGQTGAAPWDAVLPARFLEAITRFGWDDWRARKTAHFLSDTLAPAPWVERILAAATRAPDPLLDREIVRDALHAGCLASEVLAGSSGTRVQAVFVAPRTLVIDEGWVVAGGRRVHWLPPGLRTPRSIEIDSRAEIDRWLDELTG